MSGKKVVVGMSGGVDSSVAACLLLEQGYDVIGVTMEMWQEDRTGCPGGASPDVRTAAAVNSGPDANAASGRDPGPGSGAASLGAGAASGKDPGPGSGAAGLGAGAVSGKDSGLASGASSAVSDAGRVAAHLGIPHYVVDFREVFQKKVVDYFVNAYREGRTPNPCIACNRYVKWEALLGRARELGAEFIATGHYARIDTLPNGRRAVRSSATAAKDQTYALYGLTQDQLAKTLMPVGEFSKEEIRMIARRERLPVAEKADSQEICFIPDQDYAAFIGRYTGVADVPGNYVDKTGAVLGRHRGIIHYTIGQRKGLGLSMGHPVFVTEIRPRTGEVVIGEAEDVFTDIVYASHINYMALSGFEEGRELMGKVRYGHRGSLCRVRMLEADLLECRFAQPVRAVTPGQALVLYDGEYVAGGGTIIRQEEIPMDFRKNRVEA